MSRLDPRPTVTVAGWRIVARGGRVYLTEVETDRDPGLSPHQTTALTVALRAAVQQAIRQSRADR